jgi:predicted nucleic acid-binding protein
MSDQGVVIDASAAVALVAREHQGEAVRQLLSTWNAEECPVLVASFFWLEMVNTLLRRHKWSGADALAAIHKLDTYELETVELDRALVIASLDLAERHGLSAYDAAHLAVAVQQDATLLTLDRQLAAAAGPRAVPLGDDHRLAETPLPYERDVTWPDYSGASAFLSKLRREVLERS